MSNNQFGLIGLAVMGQNLVLNAADHGFKVAVFNRTGSKTEEFMRGEAKEKSIEAFYTLEEFVASLQRPRRIQIMVQAGRPVDLVIDQLKPLLDPGDIIIDGGNSFFPDTERRAKALEAEGFRYIGMGVSGGEEGARFGPSMMPGGTTEAYQFIEPLVQAISAKAQADGEPCVTYVGPGGAGHYVKMVHNGIEYGDMQLIAESYNLLKQALAPSAEEFHRIFSEWNAGVLSSFLIEITANIFTKMDDVTGQPLVELILDKAGQKGTGKWTSQNALDIGSAIPTITAAVDSRYISAIKDERVAAGQVLSGPKPVYSGDRQQLIDAVRDALYASKICSYAQGMALLKKASAEYNYNLDLGEMARIWRGGCIIRAELLDDITNAYRRNPNLPNLLVDDFFKTAVESRQAAWRFAVTTAVQMGVPVPAMSASLAYFDSYRAARLPANLIQAQRDYFGAHTFERTDKEGVFHAQWF
ncbi:MAG: 6-phosphogluconate dehydrogenase, decarboxylating [Anaerolineae bacterium]|nr:6-phosphogluconate dehydrogenase, decarboxylating [Anaerolineae bacterium]